MGETSPPAGAGGEEKWRSSAAKHQVRSFTGIAPTVQRINPLEVPEWNRLLSAYSEHCLFHTAGWAKVLQETYGFQPSCFVLDDAHSARGLLPVMEVDSRLTGRRGVSLPFTDACSPLVSDTHSFDCLFQAALAYGRTRRWKYLELRGGKDLLPDAITSNRFYGHQVSLAGKEDELFASFRGSVRQAIRKAQKVGLKAELSQGLQAVQTFYDLHCGTRTRKHGLPPQPFAFFRNLQRHILSVDKGLVVLVRQGEKAVAGGVFFHEGDQATYKFGASDQQSLDSRGNNLAMWTAIAHYAGKGLKVLDLGRTSLAEEGLRRFKLSFGARERLIEYVRFDLRRNRFVSCRDDAFGWYNRIFQSLPIWLARMLGGFLYRHVA